MREIDLSQANYSHLTLVNQKEFESVMNECSSSRFQRKDDQFHINNRFIASDLAWKRIVLISQMALNSMGDRVHKKKGW